ncbi:putative LRR receptor-like serine/threonine-protein kinase [Camellia lanceoleosa]|uniref:LRR receptor-like serine/threonine-protein kinase n=2 Tax=Camellia lanceoleosa TaxID=1840588 RepID=A0ACC0I0J7_9ERIC|nr:putative LRR receptor-like serine/threonine-protein kinase [Camellia lanceoleosa]KAI8020092.1 putative LRR receptor-like serine/threonine-protein kinase [Camellia lanceoleosa]
MTTTIDIKDALRTSLFLFLLSFFLSKYSSEGKVSTKGDTYNYGTMLLETFTRKKPTDEMFSEAQSLKQWVNASLPYRVMEVVDCGLLRTEDGWQLWKYQIAASSQWICLNCVLLSCATLKMVLFSLATRSSVCFVAKHLQSLIVLPTSRTLRSSNNLKTLNIVPHMPRIDI